MAVQVAKNATQLKNEIQKETGQKLDALGTSILNAAVVSLKKSGEPLTQENLNAFIQSPAGFALVQTKTDRFITTNPASVRTEANAAVTAGRVGEVFALLGGLTDVTVDLSPGSISRNMWMVGHDVGVTAHQNVGISITNTTTSTTAPTTEIVQVAPVFQQVTTSGTVTDVVARNNSRTVIDVSYREDKSSTISQKMIPFMRSISVLVSAKGLKPLTNMFTYFDSFDVSDYVVPSTHITVSPISGQSFIFDKSTNAGNPTSQRTILQNPITALQSGDIITGSTSSATGVLVNFEPASATNKTLAIVNIKGTFQSGEVVTGSISGSKGTITAITIPTTITTTQYGNFNGIFTIPNNSIKQFLTGSRRFLISEAPPSAIATDSFATAEFVSNGFLNLTQPVLTSIRVESPRTESWISYDNVTRQVSTTENVLVSAGYQQVITHDGVTTTNTNTLGTGTISVDRSAIIAHFNDPLAQSFFVSESPGICVTAVDLYFASKDTTLPVTVSIINVVAGGQPGNLGIPLSEVVIPAENIIVSSTTLVSDVDGRTYATPETPTKITFPSPIYLAGGNSYCIFIRSDSFKYNLWSSYMGDATVNGLGIVTKQPTLGTLFKSQSSISWSTDQLQDLVFTLYRAKFTPNVNVTVPFENVPRIAVSLYNNIGSYIGSNKLRIRLYNHGMLNGHQFTISGMVATFNGIPSSEINSTFTISNVELDYFVITVTTAATATGINIDLESKGTINVRFDSIQPIVNDLVVSGTDIKYEYKAVTINNVKPSLGIPVINNRQSDTTETFFVMSPVNESYYSSPLNGEKSVSLNATMSTTSEYVTPFIDAHRVSMMVGGNKLDSPTTDLNVVGIDYNNLAISWASSIYVDANTIIYQGTYKYSVTVGGKFNTVAPSHTSGSATNGTVTLLYLGSTAIITVNATDNKFETANTALKTKLAQLYVGSYVTVSGCTNSVNNGVFKVLSKATDGSSITVDTDLIADTSALISILVGTRYRAETTPGGSSSISAYVSKELRFANLSTSFKLIFTYNKPTNADITLYYKISNSYDSVVHSTQSYIELVPDKDLISSDNKEKLYTANLHTLNLTSFNTLSIKIVYNSVDTNKFPRLRDFRVIALA